MKSLPAKFGKSAKLGIAAFMTFWLSGILFLVCCQMPEMQAKEICPLAKKGKSHCDKAKSDTKLPLVSKESGKQNLDCCGFLPAVFDKTRKIEKHQQIAQPVAKVKVDLPKFVFAENSFEVFENYRPPPENRHKIFIKNCVFRI